MRAALTRHWWAGTFVAFGLILAIGGLTPAALGANNSTPTTRAQYLRVIRQTSNITASGDVLFNALPQGDIPYNPATGIATLPAGGIYRVVSQLKTRIPTLPALTGQALASGVAIGAANTTAATAIDIPGGAWTSPLTAVALITISARALAAGTAGTPNTVSFGLFTAANSLVSLVWWRLTGSGFPCRGPPRHGP